MLAQRCDSFEAIVVNDGDDSETNAYVDQLCDARIRVFRHPEALGASASRNRGISEARGALIAFLDDDDELKPDFLQRHLQAFESDNSLGWTWSGIEKIECGADSAKGACSRTIWATAASDRAYLYQLAVSFGVVVRAELLRSLGGFDTKMTVSEDIDLFLRLEASGAKCKPIPHVLVSIYAHAGTSLSRSSIHTKFIESIGLLLKKNARLLDRYPHVRRHHSLSLLGHLYRANHLSRARKLSWELFSRHPFSWAVTGKILRFEFKNLGRSVSQR